MKINNKGLAISTMLFGALIMASVIMFLILGTMAFRRRTTIQINEMVEQELDNTQYGSTFSNNCPIR